MTLKKHVTAESISNRTVWHWGILSACWHQHRLSLFMTYSFYMVAEYYWNGRTCFFISVETVNAAIYITYILSYKPSWHPPFCTVCQHNAESLLTPKLLFCSWLTSDLSVTATVRVLLSSTMYLQVNPFLQCRVGVTSICGYIFSIPVFYFSGYFLTPPQYRRDIYSKMHSCYIEKISCSEKCVH